MLVVIFWKPFIVNGVNHSHLWVLLSKRLWSSGYDWTLPTSRPGFDSRQTQIFSKSFSTTFFAEKLGVKKNLEERGIDPRASRMLSERSTM